MVTKRRSSVDGVFATTTDLINYAGTWAADSTVTTDGFTTVGDGGGAKWKLTGNTIAASQTPALTGNATLSDANGNEFVLVGSKGFINPDELGADATGTSDSFAALLASHNHANNNDIPVVARGAYLINATGAITVKTNSDYSLATLTIPDSVNVSILFEIDPTSPFVVFNPAATSFKKGSTFVSEFAAYPFSVMTIISNDRLVERSGTTTINKNDIVYHSEEGHISHPLQHDMSSINLVSVNPLEDSELIFKAPKVIVGNCKINSFIKSERNQVYVYGASVTNNATTGNIPIDVYFHPSRVINNVLDGRYGDVLSDFGQSFAYDYSGQHVINPKVVNLITPRNWGGVDGNTYRNLIVDNCITSRVGCHSELMGGVITNSTLTEKAVQVTGYGLLELKNVTKTISTVSSGSVAALVALRDDYGASWDGEIIIDGFSLNCGDVDLTSKSPSVVQLDFEGDVDYMTPLVMPNITIKNGEIVTSSNPSSPTEIYYVETLRYTDSQSFVNRILPKNITIENVNVTVPVTSSLTRALPFRSPNVVSNNVSGDIHIKVVSSGIDYDTSTLPLLQDGKDLRIVEDLADLPSPTHKEFYTFVDKKVDMIFRAPLGWTAKTINCDVYNVDCFFSSVHGLGFVDIRNSNLWSGRYSGDAPKSFYASTLKVDGTTNTANINAGVVRLSENNIELGFTLTGKTKSEFVNGFYDITYWEPL